MLPRAFRNQKINNTMNYIKSPQGIVAVTICLALILIFTVLRPESVAQTTSTAGGRFQCLAPTENKLFVFDTATARIWRYNPPLIGLGVPPSKGDWEEFSPGFAGK